MKSRHEDPELGKETSEGNAASSRLRRRDMLRLSAIGVGVGLPVVMTLVPSRARAEGSWRCVPGNQAGAQGSWNCNGGRPGWDKDRSLHAKDAFERVDERKSSFVIPGTHDWRKRREEEEERKRKMQGEFGRFGSDEDWR